MQIVPLAPETLLDDHAIQRLLCDKLEAVADGLPALPPLCTIRRLCDMIIRITSTHFARAEKILASLPPEQRPSAVELSILHQMHQLDEAHAQDLVAELWSHAAGRPNGGIGQLAYMLRCYFDGGRRAIALKESWIAASDQAMGVRP
ncbi:MAG TPA: hypothetical protein VFF84_00230 [Sphingobium sp.]|nr:hypothetical protein [Sphingobium sp.]